MSWQSTFTSESAPGTWTNGPLSGSRATPWSDSDPPTAEPGGQRSAARSRLTVRRDTDLPAVFQHRTNRAFRKSTGANVLAERHQQAVDLDPVFSRQLLFQRQTRRVGRRSAHQSPPVGDAMHVNVDADLSCAACDAEREVGALRTDAAEGGHDLEIARHLAAEFVDDSLRHVPDVVRLGLIKARRLDQAGNLLHAQFADGLGGRRRLIQSQRGWQRNLVHGSYGYDAGGQLMERRGEPSRGEIEHRRVGKLLNFLPYATQHLVNVESTLGRPDARGHAP